MFLNIKLCGAYSNQCVVQLRTSLILSFPLRLGPKNRDKNLNGRLWLQNNSGEANGKIHGLPVTDVQNAGLVIKPRTDKYH